MIIIKIIIQDKPYKLYSIYLPRVMNLKYISIFKT